MKKYIEEVPSDTIRDFYEIKLIFIIDSVK